jgi:hypothetical protein
VPACGKGRGVFARFAGGGMSENVPVALKSKVSREADGFAKESEKSGSAGVVDAGH